MAAAYPACCNLVKLGFHVKITLCRVEALAAEQQLRAAQSEAGHGSAVRAQLQSELSAVEAQRQQSQAQLLQAEQLVQQLQVRTTRTLQLAVW